MTETPLMKEIRSALNAQPGVRLWRNNTGVDPTHGVRYGLAVGSADLVGLVTPGRFFALEIKTPRGRVSPDQQRWLDTVRSFGGFATIVRSVDEALAALSRARAGAPS